jgi:hypothetical protein
MTVRNRQCYGPFSISFSFVSMDHVLMTYWFAAGRHRKGKGGGLAKNMLRNALLGYLLWMLLRTCCNVELGV